MAFSFVILGHICINTQSGVGRIPEPVFNHFPSATKGGGGGVPLQGQRQGVGISGHKPVLSMQHDLLQHL